MIDTIFALPKAFIYPSQSFQELKRGLKCPLLFISIMWKSITMKEKDLRKLLEGILATRLAKELIEMAGTPKGNLKKGLSKTSLAAWLLKAKKKINTQKN